MKPLSRQRSRPRPEPREPSYPRLGAVGLVSLGVFSTAACGGVVAEDPLDPGPQREPPAESVSVGAGAPQTLGAGGALPDPMPSGVPIE